MQVFQNLNKHTGDIATVVAGAALWVVSFWTNFIGARWLFGEQDQLPWVSFLCALAIASSLLRVAWNVASSVKRNRKALPLSIVLYLLMLLVSSAFTYQALFLRFSLSEEKLEGALRVSHEIENVKAKYETCLRKKWDLDSKARSIADHRAKVDFERVRPDRPGKGELWIDGQQKLEERTAEHKHYEDLIKQRLSRLDALAQPTAGVELSRNAALTAATLTAVLENMDSDGCSVANRAGIDLVLDEARTKESPLYAFRRLTSWTEPHLPVVIAVCLSLLLEIIPLVLFLATYSRAGSPLAGDRRSGDWESIIK